MTRPFRAAAAALVLMVGLTTSGCNALRKDLGCPGARCTKELAAVRGRIALLPGVTGVDAVEYHYGFDTGRSGSVRFRARPTGSAAAKLLNRRVLALYRAGGPELSGASYLEIQLAWDPERLVPRTDMMSTSSAGSASPGSGSACSPTRCRTQLGAVRRRLHDAGTPAGVTVKALGFRPHGSGGQPEVVVRLATDLRMADIDRIRAAADAVSRVLAHSGITASYEERVLVTHPVQHTMLTRWTSYDGYTDLADQQAVVPE